MAKAKQINIRAALGYFRESREELKKVSWPTRQQTIRYTIIVAVASIAISILTASFDYILSLIIERIV